MRKFNKSELKKVESLVADFGFEFDMVPDESGNQVYYLKKADLEEFKSFIEENKADYGFIDLENFQKKAQVHIARDKDIKVNSKKLGSFGVKLIYHRKSDNSLEYRVFISYKDGDGRLVRRRLANDSIKSIQGNKEAMVEYFNKISESQLKAYTK